MKHVSPLLSDDEAEDLDVEEVEAAEDIEGLIPVVADGKWKGKERGKERKGIERRSMF